MTRQYDTIKAKTALLLLLMMVMGATGAWGQTKTASIDFSSSIIDNKVQGTVNYMEIGTHPSKPTTINSDGRLVLGNTTNTVTIPEAQRDGTIVTVSFDLAFGKLVNRSVYFNLKDTNGDNIAYFSFSPYTGESSLSTNMGVTIEDLYYGSNTADWDKKVWFSITLDYSTHTITTRTVCAGAINKDITHSAVTMTNTNALATFEVGSNYDNTDRYCQFDNLEISSNTTQYAYKLMSDGGTVIATGTAASSSKITIPYPQFEQRGTTLYETAANGSGDYYRRAYTLSYPNGTYDVVNYTKGSIANVLYYTEAENVSGMKIATSTERASYGQMGYTSGVDDYIDATTLWPGKYQIYLRAVNGNETTRNAKFKVGNEVKYTTSFGKGTNFTANSEVLEVPEKGTLSISCEGSSISGIDWFYVKTQNISFPITSGTISQQSATTVTVYNATSATTFTSSDPSVVTVLNNNDGTITLTSYNKNGTATITATENGNTATYAITVETGTLAFEQTAKTAYLEDLTFQYGATSSSLANITYSVPANNGVAYVHTGQETTGILHLTKQGNVVVTATDERGLTATYTLTVGTRNVLSAVTLTTGETFDVGTAAGRLTDESVTINGTTLYFGANSADNSKDEQQVVRGINGGYGVTCIDQNGYIFGNITDYTNGSYNQWGTYYRIDTGSEVGTVIITGYFDNIETNAYLYDTSGKRLATIYDTGAELATMVFDDQMLEPNTTYYLYSPNAVFALKSFTHTKVKATLDYANSYEGVMFCGDVLSAPTLTIKDANGTDILSHYTRGTYKSSKPAYATVDSGTGVLTATATKGRTVVSLTLTSDAPETYPDLVVTDTIDVTDGMWDFRTYTRDNGAYRMYLSSGWSGYWNDYPMTKDNKDFEFVLMNQEFTDRGVSYYQANNGEPLPLAIGLRSRYLQRLIWSQLAEASGGNLHLRGKGVGVNTAAYGEGGEIKIPVKEGMLIEINCKADDEQSEMKITGATNLDGSDVEYFYVDNGDAQTFRFLGRANGYVYIKNPSTNLELYINYIKVSSNMVFEYGEETYTDPTINGNKFTNAVLNKGTTTLSYSPENLDGAGMCNSINENGEATLRDASYGSYKVTVTGSGSGILAGQTGSYTVHSIGFTFNTPASELLSATGTRTYTSSELKNLLSISSYGLDNNALKNKVEFSVLSTSPFTTIATTSGKVGDQSLTIEGSGSVVVQAKLGAITKQVAFQITGADLNDRAPVILNDTETGTYTVEIIGDKTKISNITFDKAKMKEGILGDLDATQIELEESTDADGKKSLIIRGLDQGKTNTLAGGTIPLIASCEYEGIGTVHMSGVLTVAYKEHTWNFQSNLIPTLGNWYSDTTTDPKTKEGVWTANATFDQPTDAGVHSDDNDWRFARKIGGHTDVSIIYYYNHSSEGLNALIIPETSGLHIHSTKADKQLGVEMATDASHAAAVTGGKYSCTNLMLLRGGKLIIPKVKPGQWIEVRWTRHKEDMAERMSMENLLDVDGKYITGTYKIGNCHYEMDGTNSTYNNYLSTSTYMFQVASPEDGGDALDADGCVDAVFSVQDNIYVSIQEIILHEPGWEFKSSYSDKLMAIDYGTYVDVKQLLDAGTTITLNQPAYQNAPNAPYSWELTTDPTLEADITNGIQPSITYQGGYGRVYVTLTSYSQDGSKYVANRKTWNIAYGIKPHQTYPYTWNFENISGGAVKGWSNNAYNSVSVDYDTWTGLGYETYQLCTDDGSLYVPGATLVTESRNLGVNASIEELNSSGDGCDEFNGLGFTGQFAFKVAQVGSTANDAPTDAWSRGAVNELLSYALNVEISNSEEHGAGDGKILFGAPGNIGNTTATADKTTDKAYNMNGGNTKYVLLMPQRPLQNGDKITLRGYAESKMQDAGFSFYVNSSDDKGDDLVTLHFPDLTAKKEQTLTHTVTQGDGLAGRSRVYLFRANKTTTAFLTSVVITGNDENPPTSYGYTRALNCIEPTTITIPDLVAGHYVYIKASQAPTAASLAASNLTAATAADGLDAAGGVYKYKVTANGNADVTFEADAKVYRIGVTNIMKPMKRVGEGDVWATESRDHSIDYTHTGVFTVNDVKAHTVSATNYAPQKLTVKMNDVDATTINDTYPAVTEQTGLVLRLAYDESNFSKTKDYADKTGSVPLFYPPYTTPILGSDIVGFGGSDGNLMMACVEGKTWTEEKETIDGVDYVPFILAERYMKWTKEGNESPTTEPFAYSGNLPVFYRMHLYSSDEITANPDGGLTSNTISPNKAYLLISSDNVPKALWDTSAGAKGFIGIEGVSDMEEFSEDSGHSDQSGQSVRNTGTYNLRGQQVNDNAPLPSGVYIRNGKKIIVK